MVEITRDALGGTMNSMAENQNYTPYHPRWYRVRMPIFWWIRRLSHVKFITRELTSVAVACYALVLLWQVFTLSRGPEAYARFLNLLRTPLSIALHGIAFLFVLFHSITWFNLAPKAMVLNLGSRRVPAPVIAILNYVAWMAFSIAIAWILLRT